MWVLDFQPEITSDFSVFHRIRDPLSLGFPRYYQDASLLRHYGGALAAALDRQRAVEAPPVPVAPQLGQPGMGGERPVVVDDVRTVAAMTNVPGFPGIEFVGG